MAVGCAHARPRARRSHLDQGLVDQMRATAARRWPSRPSPRSSTRCPATPARSAARWARTSSRPCSWRWAASSRWPRGAATPTRGTPIAPAARGRLRSWAAARPAAAGRSTRCSRPTGSARGCPGARCPRPRWPTASTADTLAAFAELVFAYIDELSAASVAGHTDELATSGRVRQRYLERLARHLLRGAPADAWSRPPSAPAGSRRRR